MEGWSNWNPVNQRLCCKGACWLPSPGGGCLAFTRKHRGEKLICTAMCSLLQLNNPPLPKTPVFIIIIMIIILIIYYVLKGNKKYWSISHTVKKEIISVSPEFSKNKAEHSSYFLYDQWAKTWKIEYQ